jgi:hypothetical protein
MMGHDRSLALYHAVCVLGFAAAAAQGAVVAAWDFEPAPPLGIPSLDASTVAANVTASAFTSSDGKPTRVTSSGPVYWVAEEGWTDANTFLSCTVQAADGFEIQLASLVFDQSALAATAPTTWRVRSSLDGFTADLATGTVSTNPTFTEHTVDLTGTTVSSTPVEFRWYGTGATHANTSWGLDDVTVNGQVVATADPTQPAATGCCASAGGLQGMFVMPAMLGVLFWMKVRTRRSHRNVHGRR